MKTKFILSADDYGPIQYINRGVRKAVEHGVINSVQVIINYKESTLYNDLKLLNPVVPKGGKMDGYIGVKMKSFEDRAIELRALLRAKQGGKLDAFFESDGALWDNCSTVKFLKN
ncbi:MAG: hypothetical protein ACI8ZM_003385 [Crocinitomix sp.]|jgi:hypothetical protein